jgi:type 1 glutamine amidotransferase
MFMVALSRICSKRDVRLLLLSIEGLDMTRFLKLCCLMFVLSGSMVVAADIDPFDQSSIPIEEQPTDPKATKIVLISGLASPKMKTGEHEYFAGCAVLMKLLKQTPGIAPVLARDGWPKKPETLQSAKCVVLFLEGADIHTVIKGDRMNELNKLAESGVGIVHLHSSIDYPKDFGERVRSWSGAVWEKGFSKRAHWVNEYSQFPEHAITRGVTPFKIDDGYLYKLRFVPELKGITPLLKTISPKEAKIKQAPEESIVAWTYERQNGGRSFNFTGCHLHESLVMEGYRRFLINGILWAAGQEIPKEGAPVKIEPEELKRYFDPKAKK